MVGDLHHCHASIVPVSASYLAGWYCSMLGQPLALWRPLMDFSFPLDCMASCSRVPFYHLSSREEVYRLVQLDFSRFCNESVIITSWIECLCVTLYFNKCTEDWTVCFNFFHKNLEMYFDCYWILSTNFISGFVRPNFSSGWPCFTIHLISKLTFCC